MVADDPHLRQALQQTSSSSDSFVSEDDSSETTGKITDRDSLPVKLHDL